MKNFFKTSTILAFVIYGIVNEVIAQRSTGINNTTPSTKAALDVSYITGTPQGILVPRLPKSDSLILENAITPAEKGLMFFDTDNNVYRYWNGTKWVSLGGSSASSNLWTQSGANIYYNTGNVSIGASTFETAKLFVSGNGSNIREAGVTIQGNSKWFLGDYNGNFTINQYSGATYTPFNIVNSSQTVQIPKLQIADGNEGAGKVFTSDATGLGSWQPAGGNNWALAGNTFTDSSANFFGTTTAVPVAIRTNNQKRMHIATNGSVGIGMVPTGTYILEIAGNLKTAGITETSDLRWKKDVKTLSNSLAKVGQLRGVSYNWRKDEFPEKNFDNKEQIGLIAQEVEKIFPQLVDTDALGFKSIQYSKVVALLIEALKEQQVEINSMKAEVIKMSQLENKVDSLTALVEILAKQNPVVESRK